MNNDNDDFSQEFIDRYDELLNDCHDDVVIAGITFAPAAVLLTMDPVAYRCGLVDCEDAEEDDENEE